MDLMTYLDGLTETQRRLIQLCRLLAEDEGRFLNGLDLLKSYAERFLSMHPDDAESEGEALAAKVEPHSAYPPATLGRVYRELLDLAQPWKCRYPLFETRGQIGDPHDDDPCGPEYLDVRLTPLARVLLPIGKPPLLPMALINGYRGDDGSSFPSHNLHDVWIATEHVRQNPDVRLEDLMEVLVGPDLAFGGELWGYSSLMDLYATGEGNLTFRGTIEDEIQGSRTRVAVSGVPPGVLIRDVVGEIRGLARNGRITVYDIQDLSTAERVRIVIDAPRTVEPADLRKVLYQETSLQRTEKFSFRLTQRAGNSKTEGLIKCLKVAVSHCSPAWRRKSGDPVERLPPLDVLLSHGGYESPLSAFIDSRRTKILSGE